MSSGLAGDVEYDDIVLVGDSQYGGCGYDSTLQCTGSGGYVRVGGSNLYKVRPSCMPSVGKHIAIIKVFANKTFAVGVQGCGTRIGLMGAVWDSRGAEFPRKEPFMWAHGNDMDASLGGKTTLTNIHMANWEYTDLCGYYNAAFATNPMATDNSPVHIFSGVTKSNVIEGAGLYLWDPDPAKINSDDCVDMECTGLHHTVLRDVDGSLFTGQANSQLVPSYGPAWTNDARCNLLNLTNAYTCIGTAYTELHFDSLDNDKYTRRVHPVRVLGKLVNGASSEAYLNSQQDHRWDDGYTSLLRLSRFHVAVELGGEYYISFGYRDGTVGTAPRDMRLWIPDATDSDPAVVVKFQYTAPNVHKVTPPPLLSWDSVEEIYLFGFKPDG